MIHKIKIIPAFAITLLLIVMSYFFFDQPIAYFFHKNEFALLENNCVHFFSGFGLSYPYIVVFSLMVLLAWCFKKYNIIRTIWFLSLCMASSGFICDILKAIFGRARPVELFTHQLYGFYWFKISAQYTSFPSGHTASISGLMIGLCYLKPRWSVIFIVIALISSFARVILTAHYLSDIIASFFLSWLCVYKLYEFYLKKKYCLPKL